MQHLIYPIAALGGLGLLFGVLIGVVSKFFNVVQDERIPQITEALPGANCGGCGYSGCKAYASAIVQDGAPVNQCTVGGPAVAEQLAGIMGVEAGEFVEKKAVVLCCGTRDAAALRYEYEGISDCVAANRLGGGQKACAQGCLGFGNCVAVCDRNAIEIINGVAFVNDNCKGCGQCAKECPKGLIKIVPKTAKYVVSCSSTLKGAALKDKCTAGCIGCKMCEKVCPSGAIKVENNIAVIDYEKCTSCGACSEKCPKKVIRDITVMPKAEVKEVKKEETKKLAAEDKKPVTPVAEVKKPAVAAENTETAKPQEVKEEIKEEIKEETTKE